MRHAILNVAFGAPAWWPRGQTRLWKSLDAVGYTGERFFWTESLPDGSPSHADAPYAFKAHAFDHARKEGAELALWLDASCWATKPLDPVFDWLAGHEVLLLEDNQYTIGQWCSDAALGTLGFKDRDEALSLQTCYALMIGINLTTVRGNEFLDRWLALSRDGVTFAGPKELFGEQSAAAALAWQLGIQMHRGWLPFFSLPHWPHADEAIVLGQGM